MERDPDTVREPDIAYFSADTSPLDERVTGYAEVAPDLVVEITSPGDSRREINDKALMWLSFGVRLVWVVDPERRTVDVHRANRSVVTLERRRRRRLGRPGRPARLYLPGTDRLRPVAARLPRDGRSLRASGQR